MFKKLKKVVKEKEKEVRNPGYISDIINLLRERADSVSSQICYIYDRSNDNQKVFLNKQICPYIKIEDITLITSHPYDDWPDESKLISRKIVSIDIPYSLREEISDLYIRMREGSIPTTAEAERHKAEVEMRDGFRNYFNK